MPSDDTKVYEAQDGVAPAVVRQYWLAGSPVQTQYAHKGQTDGVWVDLPTPNEVAGGVPWPCVNPFVGAHRLWRVRPDESRTVEQEFAVGEVYPGDLRIVPVTDRNRASLDKAKERLPRFRITIRDDGKIRKILNLRSVYHA